MRGILILICLMGLTGCISYHQEGDDRVSQAAHVTTGETSGDWLLENLGKPRHKKVTSRGTEVWHYRFSEREKTRVSFLILFRISNVSDTVTDLYLELEDSLVVDYWYD